MRFAGHSATRECVGTTARWQVQRLSQLSAIAGGVDAGLDSRRFAISAEPGEVVHVVCER